MFSQKSSQQIYAHYTILYQPRWQTNKFHVTEETPRSALATVVESHEGGNKTIPRLHPLPGKV